MIESLLYIYDTVMGARIYLIFAWYDFWVGLYWDRVKKRLYVLPIPCLGLVIYFKREQ